MLKPTCACGKEMAFLMDNKLSSIFTCLEDGTLALVQGVAVKNASYFLPIEKLSLGKLQLASAMGARHTDEWLRLLWELQEPMFASSPSRIKKLLFRAYHQGYLTKLLLDTSDAELLCVRGVGLRSLRLIREAFMIEADKRQAEFESCPTSIDYDNDCAP